MAVGVRASRAVSESGELMRRGAVAAGVGLVIAVHVAGLLLFDGCRADRVAGERPSVDVPAEDSGAQPRERERVTTPVAPPPEETPDVVDPEPPPIHETASIRVEGRVVDPAGNPVADAAIHAGTWPSSHVIATSGSDGRFSFEAATSGMGLTARAPGRQPSFKMNVRAVDATPVDIVLVVGGPAGRVVGRVLDHRQQPVAGVVVVVGSRSQAAFAMTSDGQQARRADAATARTDELGEFVVDGLPGGTTAIEVRQAERSRWVGSAMVRVGAATRVDIELAAPASLRGVLHDASGQAAKGAVVTLHLPDGAQEIRTDIEGVFLVADLSPGWLSVEVRSGGAGARASLFLPAGRETTWDGVLTSQPGVVGRVLEADGSAATGCTVTLTPPEFAPSAGARTTTGGNGEFAFPNVRDYEFTIAVHRGTSALPLSIVTDIRPGQGDVAIQFPADDALCPGIRGVVHDAAGAPLPGATVLVSTRHPATTAADRQTDAAGQFDTGPLPPGTYRVEITHGTHGLLPVGETFAREGHAIDLGLLTYPTAGALAVQFEGNVQFKGNVQFEGIDVPAGTSFAIAIDGPRSNGRVVARGDATGEKTIALLPGRYALRISGAVMGDVHRFVVSAGSTEELVIEIRPASFRVLHLVPPQPLEASDPVRVEVRRPDGDVIWSAPLIAGPEGKLIAIAHLRPGTCSVGAHGAFGVAEADFEVPEDGDPKTPLRIPLR